MTIREIYKNSEQFLNKEVKLGGWIRSIRGSKHFGFLVLHDGTFFKPIQVVYEEKLENFQEISKMNVGAAVIVEGLSLIHIQMCIRDRYICDGATLQLGIGSMPNALGELIAETDRKDLGMHTELCSDAYLHLYKAGKLTNKKKTIDRGKGVFGVCLLYTSRCV